MRIELRILSGARAGESEVFDQQTILVGRKSSNNLRFDTHGDLDVSAMHAELHEHGGTWYVTDAGSTNGTFVNGVQAKSETRLNDGDVIAFGKAGPTVEVRAKGDITGSTPAIPRTGSGPAAKSAGPIRQSTQERVAILVRDQTRGVKTMLIGSMIGLGGLAIVAYWIGTREGSKQVAEMQRILAQTESVTAALRNQASAKDSSFSNALTRQFDSLRTKAAAAAAKGNEAQIAAMKKELERSRVMQQGLTTMDFSGIHERNNGAVAFLITELDGKLYSGTAFSITPRGLMVTNRHNVRSTTGAPSTRLEVQFANSTVRLPAKIVKVSDVEGEDLALIQVETPGQYPTVEGVSGSGEVKVGSPLVTIGFPLSLDLQMQGNMVNTTLSGATAAKRIPDLLQLDSFGAHGLSGAPVFDSRGQVVGVVWGGLRGEDARVVYAVPSDRVAIFIGEAGKSIVR